MATTSGDLKSVIAAHNKRQSKRLGAAAAPYNLLVAKYLSLPDSELGACASPTPLSAKRSAQRAVEQKADANKFKPRESAGDPTPVEDQRLVASPQETPGVQRVAFENAEPSEKEAVYARLLDVLRALPRKQRESYEAHRLRGLTLAKAAAELRRGSPSTVQSQVIAAKRALDAALGFDTDAVTSWSAPIRQRPKLPKSVDPLKPAVSDAEWARRFRNNIDGRPEAERQAILDARELDSNSRVPDFSLRVATTEPDQCAQGDEDAPRRNGTPVPAELADALDRPDTHISARPNNRRLYDGRRAERDERASKQFLSTHRNQQL